jgi:hypothetical protein
VSSATLEQVIRKPCLGLELLDAARGRRVCDGLSVKVASINHPDRLVNASANPSGIFVAHELPGLAAWSWGGTQPVPQPQFDVWIDDRLGRFLPCHLRLALPEDGLAHLPCRTDIPLFSAPTRIVPGLAAIRAELFNPAIGKPAAWTLAEVRHLGTPICQGMADGHGRLLLAFPYPELEAPAESLAATRWPLTLHVRHQPGLNAQQPPELCAALAQPVARFVNDAAPLSPLAEIALTLRFGQETFATQPGRSQLHLTT